MKWEYLATAPDQWTAEVWAAFLWEEDVPTMIKTGDVIQFLGASPLPVRLMVDSERKREAILCLRKQIQEGFGEGLRV